MHYMVRWRKVCGVRKMGANLVMSCWISGMGWGGSQHGFGVVVGWRARWKKEEVDPLWIIFLICFVEALRGPNTTSAHNSIRRPIWVNFMEREMQSVTMEPNSFNRSTPNITSMPLMGRTWRLTAKVWPCRRRAMMVHRWRHSRIDLLPTMTLNGEISSMGSAKNLAI